MTTDARLPLSTRLLPIAALGPLLVAAGVVAQMSDFQSNPAVHSLVQLVLACLCIGCAALALKNNEGKGSNALIIVALGLLGAAFLDLCHGVLAMPSFRPETLQEVVPWGWLPARIFLPGMLCLGLLVEWYEKKHGATGQGLLLATCILAGFVVAAVSMFFIVLPIPLPPAYFPDTNLPRPAELFPAFLFSLAAAGYLYKGTWRSSYFEYNLLLALLVSIAIHALLMAQAQANFDSHFVAAVIAKIVSYALILIGLILEAREGIKQETADERLRHETIVELANDGILSLDSQGTIESANYAIEKLFGYSRDELLLRNIELLMPKSVRDGHEDVLSCFLGAGNSDEENRYRDITGRRKDGSTFPMEVAGSEIELHGKPLFTAIVRDISERKQKEAKLEEARAEAVEATRAKSSFLATMSHEIRTPLNGVLGMIELLQQTELRENQADKAALIHKSARSLMAIIEDVLDFSKIEAGKLELDLAEIDVARQLQDTCAMLDGLAKKEAVDLTLTVAEGMPAVVSGDGLRLRQIMTNLINNAIKFSSKQEHRGQVRVIAEVAESYAKNAVIRFQVIDNGIGMDAQTMARLFNPFTQADVSTSRYFGGTGLGLAISQRLSTLMGGEIRVASEPGAGATFTLELPFLVIQSAKDSTAQTIEKNTSASREDPVAVPGRAEAISSNTLILVAEDNPMNREVLMQQLAVLGYRADFAVNGTDALAQWRGGEYALLLCDLQMPEMDGYELTKTIRAAEAGSPGIPIVAFTANTLTDEVERCKSVGMDGYLTKPALIDDVRAILQQCLPDRECRDSLPTASEPAPNSDAQPGGNPPPMDRGVLEGLVGHNPEIAARVLKEFGVHAPAIASELLEAGQMSLLAEAAGGAHKMRSAALSIGAMHLGEICSEIELAGREGEIDSLAGLTAQFEREWTSLQEYLATVTHS